MDIRNPTPWLFGGILVLTGVGIAHQLRQGSSGACAPHISPGARILLVGDSLAVGLQTPMRALATKSGCDFMAFAEGSTTMARWLRDAQVSAALASFRPTLTFVCLGTNDSKGGTPDATLASQVTQVRDWIVASGSALTWIRPPKLPFPDRVSPGVLAAGIESFPSATLPLPQPDGIHTSGRGYAGWAEHIWAAASCSPTPNVALSGLGAAPRFPQLPAGMFARARPVQVRPSARTIAAKRRRRA